MAERPLLAMPRPETRNPKQTGFPREKISAAEVDQQARRIGPRFERLERAIGHPETLTALYDDPSAIVPERALVFELASSVVDFYRAIRSVPTLEFLGENEGDADPDDIFLNGTRTIGLFLTDELRVRGVCLDTWACAFSLTRIPSFEFPARLFNRLLSGKPKAVHTSKNKLLDGGFACSKTITHLRIKPNQTRRRRKNTKP